MHHYQGTGKTGFNYSSDASGDVIIETDDGSIRVPCNDVLEFVAELVRMSKISRIEDASVEQLLGLTERHEE